MRIISKSARSLALFSLFFWGGFASADVKLRIYMKDGNLQAGNLVTESKEHFVLVTKEGRHEIPKKDIMFVNGKTLAQWEARPNKNYSTEILPNEVPNPSFINDKASLPPPVKMVPEKKAVLPPPVQSQPVSHEADALAIEPSSSSEPPVTEVESLPSRAEPMKAPTEITQKHEKAESVTAAEKVISPRRSVDKKAVALEPTPREKPASVVNKSEVVETAPIVSPSRGTLAKDATPAVDRPKRKKGRQWLSEKRVAPPLATASAPIQSAVEAAPKKIEKTSTGGKPIPSRPNRTLGSFDRQQWAQAHYVMAMELADKGLKGRSIQELHISNTLNKWDENTALALAEHYKAEGVFGRARKYFDLPSLRKKPEIQSKLRDMSLTEKKATQMRWFWVAGTAAGMLLPLPLLGWVRQRRRAKVLVVTSENLEEVAKTHSAPEDDPFVMEPAFKNMNPGLQASMERVAVRRGTETPGLETSSPMPDRPDLAPVVEEKVQSPSVPVRYLPVRPDPVISMAKDEPALSAVEPAQSDLIPAQPEHPEPVQFEVINHPQLPSGASSVSEISPSVPPGPPVVETPLEAKAREHQRILEMRRVVYDSVQKGHLLAQAGKIELARREYRTAAALDVTCLDAELGLAYLCFVQGQWELSMQHYVRALAINPESPEAHYGVGRVLFETEQFDQAVPELRKSLELDPTFQDARDALTQIESVA